MRYWPVLFFFLFCACGIACADTVDMKDGQQKKGVVVEDYHDRIVISTYTGELSLLKSDIQKIDYETPEYNLVKLAGAYRDKEDYKTALYYYEAAAKVNPGLKEAKEGTLLMNSMIYRKKEADLEAQVSMRQDIEENRGLPGQEEAPREDPLAADKKELLEKAGITLDASHVDIKIDQCPKDSPAGAAGIVEGDIVVSIWGKLTRYMQLKDVYDLFMGSKVSECRIVISRDIPVPLQKAGIFGSAEGLAGVRFLMQFEGLTVDRVDPQGAFGQAGITQGDMITQIGNFPTRYMPLETARRTIKTLGGETAVFKIQREISFWKR